jgi:hypothetical protein
MMEEQSATLPNKRPRDSKGSMAPDDLLEGGLKGLLAIPELRAECRGGH